MQRFVFNLFLSLLSENLFKLFHVIYNTILRKNKMKRVYLLFRNDRLEWAGSNIKATYAAAIDLLRLVEKDNIHSYVQVTRIMRKNKAYVFTTLLGATFKILNYPVAATYDKEFAD